MNFNHGSEAQIGRVRTGIANSMLKTFSSTLIIWLLQFNIGSAQNIKIADLRSQGWTEIERREEIKNYPGDSPYENLTRVIQLTHFVFEKDKVKKFCWISYDSQRDQIREGCRLR